MPAQVIQEIMNSEKAKKAAERAALRAQEAHRLMMEEPAEHHTTTTTMRDDWLVSRVTGFWGVMHIVHSTCVHAY